MSKILREYNNRKITILVMPTHESYQTNLSKLPYDFIMLEPDKGKKWNDTFRPIPKNHTYVRNLSPDIQFDCVLSQNKFAQHDILKNIAAQRRVPLIDLCHTTCDLLPLNIVKAAFNKKADVNVFISEYSANQWGHTENYHVVNHMIDTNLFKPSSYRLKKIDVLSVVNDYKERDSECGYSVWQKIVHQNDLPHKLVGTSNCGISTPAKNVNALSSIYNDHILFLNTSLVSPLPMSVLEAMAAGLCVISSATCAIPEVIKHGENGFLYDPYRPNDAYELISKLYKADTDYLINIGTNARNTILNDFNENKFINSWCKIIEDACR